MSTNASIASVIAGPVISVKGGASFTYSVSGTFTAVWVLEMSTSGGAGWTVVATGTNTGNASGTVVAPGDPGSSTQYRFRCTARTSGTIVTTLALATVTINQIYNADGTSVFKITDAGIVVPDVQASTATIGSATVNALTSVLEIGTAGASTAAAGSTTTDAGVLPAGTGSLYATTLADDTTGVRVHATDKVTGRKIRIHNSVAAKILKVYPPTGGTINGAAADAAYSTAAGGGATLFCTSASLNTWLAW